MTAGALLAVLRKRWRIVALVVGLVVTLTLRACFPSPPARVETSTATNTAAAVVASQHSTRARERRTERTDTRPDGRRVVTVTTERETEAAKTQATVNVEVRTVSKTITIRERASWRAGASAGWRLDDLQARPELVQLHLERRIVGPWWVGAWARTDKSAGVSLAVEW